VNWLFAAGVCDNNERLGKIRGDERSFLMEQSTGKKTETNIMTTKKTSAASPLKARTGIEGFDEITNGGLPRGRTTLLEGGPGSGKTIMSLQSLVNGARLDGEPGIFVAFEESSERIIANAAEFGWDLVALQRKKLFFLDAQPKPDLVQSGSFDLSGMLAGLDAKVRELKARRIVFDALDIILALLPDAAAQRREVYRLHEWLLARGLTAVITSKAGGRELHPDNQPQLGFMQFMMDCAVVLNHDMIKGVSQRSLRVIKYRGSSFAENESPLVIGDEGLEVAGSHFGREPKVTVSNERISSGVPRLDTMLGGGYYRNSSVLITGFPGTAKTTLAGAFLESICKRGGRALFVSFDSDVQEIVRNLSSVKIRLERFVKSGLLHTKSARTVSGSAEIHLMRIRNLVQKFKVDYLVVDPVSALSKAGNENAAYNVVERLIDWTKEMGVTLLCTSPLHEPGMQVEGGTSLQISTIADTWIHLNYLVQGGERNRGLSIIKSRGSAHSNQVRELVLSDAGVTLADTYTAGGEVLMGTMRWEKEHAEFVAREAAQAAAKHKQVVIAVEEMELEGRLKIIQHELEAKRVEKQLLTNLGTNRITELAVNRKRMGKLRSADAT
jgi:circadian clock protein KaiC